MALYWQLRIIVIVMVMLFPPGCAVYYHDSDSGALNVWGFGHLKVKAIPKSEEKQAIVQRTTLTGAAVGIDDGTLGMSLGFDRRELIHIYDKNVAITIVRPESDDYFYFKFGTYPMGTFPIELEKTSFEKKENRR